MIDARLFSLPTANTWTPVTTDTVRERIKALHAVKPRWSLQDYVEEFGLDMGNSSKDLARQREAGYIVICGRGEAASKATQPRMLYCLASCFDELKTDRITPFTDKSDLMSWYYEFDLHRAAKSLPAEFTLRELYAAYRKLHGQLPSRYITAEFVYRVKTSKVVGISRKSPYNNGYLYKVIGDVAQTVK